MSTISSSNYYSVSSSSNGLSGLMSGIDTESMVKKMLSATQTKIDKQNQLKTQTEWKQEVYQGVVADINAFSSKYFDMTYGSTLSTNLASTSLFNSMKAVVSSGSAVKVASASSSAFTGDMSVIVNRLASAAKLTSTGKLSGNQTINGSAMDIDAINSAVADGGELSFTLTLDGISKTLAFKSEDFGHEINAESVKSALDTKLSKAFGTYVKAGMSDDGKLSFSINLTGTDGKVEPGHELTVTGASARSFGITPGASTLVTGMTTLGGLSGVHGGAYNFTINGTSFEFSGKDTVSGLISKINSSDAGVKVAYSSMTDTFSIESTSTGAQYGIQMSQEAGNLLSVLFGGDSVASADTVKSGTLQNNTISADTVPEFTSVYEAQMSMKVNGKDYTFSLTREAGGYTKEQVAEKFNTWLTSTFGKADSTANISYNAETGELTAADGYIVAFATAEESDLAHSLGFAGKTNAVTGDTAIADAQKLAGMNGSFLKADGTAATTLSEIASFEATDGTSYQMHYVNGALSLTGSGEIDLTGTGLERLLGETVTLGDGQMAAGAVKAGTDAELVINGVATSRSSNTFTVDGLTLTAAKVTAKDEAATVISTERDVDTVVNTIKSFVNDYNSLVKKLNDLIKQDATYRNYAPLTDSQKEEMSDKEIELWETKAKTGLVRNDSTISSFLSQMRGAMYTGSEPGGLALYNIGIETGKWDTAGQLVLDEAKLRSAIASNPSGVEALFTDKTNGLAKRLSTIADGTAKLSVASPGTLVKLAGAKDWSANAKNNDLYLQLYRINDKLSTLQTKYNNERERYWAQFSAMETAMASLSSQSSMLTSMFSSN